MAAALACASIALAGPVHDAARKGDLNKVKALLQSDPKLVSDVDSKGDTPLHVAALHGELAVAQALLDAGADVNVKNHYGAWKRPPPCSRCRWRPSRETGVWLGVGCYCKSEAPIALASPPNPDASYAFPGMPPGGRNRNLRRPSRSLGPRRATEVFRGDHIARQSQSADELAGAFHGRRDLRNRPDKARRRLFRLGRDRVEFERCCLTRRRGGAEQHIS